MTKESAAESIQLAFYATAVEADGGEVIHAQLWYPRAKTKSVSTRDLDLDRLEELQVEMVQITEQIRDEIWSPQAGDHCERCDFRLSCPAWPDGKGAYMP